MLTTVAEENLAGVRTVKAFAREDYEIKKFLSHNERYYNLNITQSKSGAVLSAVSVCRKSASGGNYHSWRNFCDEWKYVIRCAGRICGIQQELYLANGNDGMADKRPVFRSRII